MINCFDQIDCWSDLEGLNEDLLNETDKTNKKVLSILWSRFSSLNNMIFTNKIWEKLICKFVDKKELWKLLTLEDMSWKTKASLKFSYMNWYFYLDALNAYEHWKCNVLFKWKWNEWKILYKYYLEDK
jgi:hypothetical protein